MGRFDRHRTVTGFAFLAFACNHTQAPAPEPASAASSVSTPVSPVSKSTAETPAAPSVPGCVVALPDEPPPRAKAAKSCPADPEGPPNLARAWVSFPDAPGAPRVGVEIADNPSTQQRGLMFRKTLPEDEGMLFQWRNESPRSFWMHNTCIPLDMMFIGLDGTIRGIVEQAPTLDDNPRGVACPTGMVLEVNAGYTRSHGVKPGQHVRIER